MNHPANGLIDRQYLICEICWNAIALFDPAKLTQPLRGEMFESPRPNRGIPAPFGAGLEWADFRCPACRKRPIMRPERVMVSHKRCFETVGQDERYLDVPKGEVVEQLYPRCQPGEHRWTEATPTDKAVEGGGYVCLKCGLVATKGEALWDALGKPEKSDSLRAPTADDQAEVNTDAQAETGPDPSLPLPDVGEGIPDEPEAAETEPANPTEPGPNSGVSDPYQPDDAVTAAELEVSTEGTGGSEIRTPFQPEPDTGVPEPDDDRCPGCGKASSEFKISAGYISHMRACVKKAQG